MNLKVNNLENIIQVIYIFVIILLVFYTCINLVLFQLYATITNLEAMRVADGTILRSMHQELTPGPVFSFRRFRISFKARRGEHPARQQVANVRTQILGSSSTNIWFHPCRSRVFGWQEPPDLSCCLHIWLSLMEIKYIYTISLKIIATTM